MHVDKAVVQFRSVETKQLKRNVSVKIAVKDGTVSVDNAKVVKADIETSNGVIHVIDAVILPK